MSSMTSWDSVSPFVTSLLVALSSSSTNRLKLRRAFDTAVCSAFWIRHDKNVNALPLGATQGKLR
jgi:hypothetical protein